MTLLGHSSFHSLRTILIAFPLVAWLASCSSSTAGGPLGHGGSGGSVTSTGGASGGGSGTGTVHASGGVTGNGGTSSNGGITGTGGITGNGGVTGTGGTTGSGGVTGTGGSSTGGQKGADAAAEVGTDVSLINDAHDMAALCTSTGGQLDTGLCCSSVGDLPNTCSAGACSCPPASSHTVVRCACPNNGCFSPDVGCSAPGSDGAVGVGGSSGSGGKGGMGGGTGGITGSGGITGTGGTSGTDGGAADVHVSPDAQGLAALCTSSGGQISSKTCCTSIGDFPDGCLIGACGCSPSSSHSIAVCTCPTGTCFSSTTGCASN